MRGSLDPACHAAGSSYRQVDERMDGVTVLEMTDPRWADFVAAHPAATPFHHPDWARLVASCYGFRAFALATTDETGAIRAGLPVVEVRQPLSSPKWVSLPYTDYCPPLASTRREEEQLVAALRQAGEAAGVRRVEVRRRSRVPRPPDPPRFVMCSPWAAAQRRSTPVSIARRYSATSGVRNGRG